MVIIEFESVTLQIINMEEYCASSKVEAAINRHLANEEEGKEYKVKRLLVVDHVTQVVMIVQRVRM